MSEVDVLMNFLIESKNLIMISEKITAPIG